MACFQPLLAVDNGIDRETSKHLIKFLPQRADRNLLYYRSLYGKDLMMFPCGHCVGCAKDYARTWQARIMCEASYHQKSCFLTLTYEKERDPNKDDLRHFIQDVRDYLRNNGKDYKGIKFFGCGECGSQTHRFHNHLILFGVDFSEDRYPISKRGLNFIYRSPLLEKLWKHGFSCIGSLDIASAGYVSKYCDKKKISSMDEGEFVIMSRGLGKQYFKDHLEDLFDSDYLYFDGQKFKIPRYFLTLALKEDFKYVAYASDYSNRKKEIAMSFRFDSGRSVSVEEEGMIASRDVQMAKYVNKEGKRDVL